MDDFRKTSTKRPAFLYLSKCSSTRLTKHWTPINFFHLMDKQGASMTEREKGVGIVLSGQASATYIMI